MYPSYGHRPYSKIIIIIKSCLYIGTFILPICRTSPMHTCSTHLREHEEYSLGIQCWITSNNQQISYLHPSPLNFIVLFQLSDRVFPPKRTKFKKVNLSNCLLTFTQALQIQVPTSTSSLPCRNCQTKHTTMPFSWEVSGLQKSQGCQAQQEEFCASGLYCISTGCHSAQERSTFIHTN